MLFRSRYDASQICAAIFERDLTRSAEAVELGPSLSPRIYPLVRDALRRYALRVGPRNP